MKWLKGTIVVLGLIVLTLSFSVNAIAATKTWTTDTDFSEGTLVGTKVVGTGDAASVVLKLGGTWCNADWLKRAPVTITNSGTTALTNYQVKVTVPYDADMNADFSDLRFTTDGMVTEILYWVETYTASTEATVWVKVPSVAASGDTTIYMYYGNASATSASNGDNTFLFF